jgi:hypothetical protein
MNVRNRVSTCTLIIELICPFALHGANNPASYSPRHLGCRRKVRNSAGGTSESDVATANNTIACCI